MSGPVRPNYDRAESVMAEEEAAVAVLLNSVEMGEYIHVGAKSVTPDVASNYEHMGFMSPKVLRVCYNLLKFVVVSLQVPCDTIWCSTMIVCMRCTC